MRSLCMSITFKFCDHSLILHNPMAFGDKMTLWFILYYILRLFLTKLAAKISQQSIYAD